MLDREIILTPEGYRQLKDEIEYLSTKKREEVAERIKESRDFGDIAENSEYDDAKNEQAMLEQRIYALEEKLRQRHRHRLQVGQDRHGRRRHQGHAAGHARRGDVLQYSIVGSAEADPTTHKLSNESPVGRAIMGRKPGDKVTVAVPQGSMKFKILAIERA